MKEETPPKQANGWKEKLGVLGRGKNIAKTIVSAVPHIGHVVVEMQNQIEANEVEKQLDVLSTADNELAAKVQELEKATQREQPAIPEWPAAVGEFLKRTVDLAVAYAGSEGRGEKRKELYKNVGHGCLISAKEVLTCRETLDLAQAVAQDHGGWLRIIWGLAWYDFKADAVDKSSGLLLLHLTNRDEEKWQRAQKKLGLKEPHEAMLAEVKASLTPWLGEEIGFLHRGEAENISRAQLMFSRRQFDTTTISHFRRPSEDGLKTVVTEVLGGRILAAGSPVFNRSGTLVGIVADTESYNGDAGRRAVVRSLLIHPRFRHLLKGRGKS